MITDLAGNTCIDRVRLKNQLENIPSNNTFLIDPKLSSIIVGHLLEVRILWGHLLEVIILCGSLLLRMT